MRKIVELLICFIHPLAVVLIWIDLARRADIGIFMKVIWGLAVIIPIIPFLYVLVSGDLWPFPSGNITAVDET
ncbi:MAG TPA: hypothetical protein VFW90_00495 [Candidatus Saccharimonadales bacterium]|nr:hypothetical protein [Candidatus Saccharimonadales bacterium]